MYPYFCIDFNWSVLSNFGLPLESLATSSSSSSFGITKSSLISILKHSLNAGGNSTGIDSHSNRADSTDFINFFFIDFVSILEIRHTSI